MSKCRLCCAIFLALVSVAAMAAEPDEGLAARSKWFDFEAYKVAYRRSYSSLMEELMRRKCFLARAFRAFVSSSKYKLGLSPYYLAVNHMSDWTRKEVVERLHGGAANMTIADQFPSGKARRVVVGTGAEPEVGANATLSRRKRQPGVPWEYPDPYEVVDFEQSREHLESALGDFDPIGRFMGRWANQNLASRMMEIKSPRRLPNGDIVFVDHRDSGCITEVRSQVDCGACYAISVLGLLEWISCMKTRRYIEFSEQYVIDCGRPFGLKGCHEGTIRKVANFVNNVGLELRDDYPYQDKEERCPYDDQRHPNVVRGSIRMQFSKGYDFEREMMPVIVTYSPVVVRTLFILGSSINEYGGGVFTEGDCSDESPGHQVVTVGHGVESGFEYWLIRNSWGHHWGEAGYIKIDKRLAYYCLNNGGVVFATDVEGTTELDVYENHLNQRQVVGLLRERDDSKSDSDD